MTRQEEREEFWLLTKAVLQDSSIDAQEARVIKRWLEEHQQKDEFRILIDRLGRHLSDEFIDRSESRAIIESIGNVLRILRTQAAQ